MRNRFFVLVLTVTLCLLTIGSVFAENAGDNLTSVPSAIEMGDNAVTYPQLSGHADEAVQAAINSDIIISGSISSHIVTLSTLGGGSFGLQVSYKDYIGDGFYSVMLFADGKQPDGRDGHSVVALSYDLTTGKKLELSQIFANPEQAVSVLEDMAEASIGIEMTEYMEYTDVRPLPVMGFYLDETGITFCYPANQLRYLSGNPVSCHFLYEEIASLLLPAEDGLPFRLGLVGDPLSDEESRDIIIAAVKQGRLPCLPATLGDPMQDIVDAGKLLREPDSFPGGRYFLLEAPEYRSIYLISDDMQSGYEQSALMGIQQRRGGLGGLVVGASTRDQWLRILGQPDETIQFTENMAFDYQLPVGQSDHYSFGDHVIRFHSDESGVLFAIQLNK